jgi:hypothetical protein
MSTPPLLRLAPVLRRQFGIVTVAQCEANDVGSGTRAGLIRRRLLERLYRGVLRCTLFADCWEARALAAQLAAGDQAILGRWSAARLLGLTRSTGSTDIDVVVPRGTFVRDVGAVLRTSERLRLGDDTTEVAPFRCGSVPWTVGELATVASPAALARIVARAIAEERTTLEELEALCERLHDVPGVTAFRELLPASRLVVVRSRSRRESQFVRLVVAAGLPRPMVNLQVADVSGQTRFLDAAWLDYGVFAEIDVHPVHGITIGRRLDGLRQNDLVPAWIPLRFDENDLDHRPDEVVATVRRALIARGWTPDDEDGATDGPSTHIA